MLVFILLKQRKRCIILTGPLASGDATLSGAVYGLYNADGVLVKSYTTNSEGTFTTDKYASCTGWYIKEITAPKGYTVDNTKHYLDTLVAPTVLTKEMTAVTMNISETVISGSFSMKKYALNTVDNTKIPEEGAKFRVYPFALETYEDAVANGDARMYDEGTVNAAGDVIWSNGTTKTKKLSYGLYVVTQTKGMEGYRYIEDFYVAIVSDGQEETFSFDDPVVNSQLTIVKVDSETNASITVSGATFKILNTDTAEYYSAKVNGETVTEFTTDKTGTIVLPTKLIYGNYKLIEVSAPNGYFNDKIDVPFAVNEKSPANITITKKNAPLKGVISIMKKGSMFTAFAATSTLVNEPGYVYQGVIYTPQFTMSYLGGVTYDIFAAEDILVNGVKKYSKGDKVDTVVTTSMGLANSVPLYLGKYEVVETKAPAGYVIDKTRHPVTVTSDGSELVVNSVSLNLTNNRVTTEISLEKEAATWKTETKGNTISRSLVYAPGAGFTFGLYTKDKLTTVGGGTSIPANSLVAIGVTDKDGKLSFNKELPFGAYYIKELGAPNDNYKISETTYPVDLTTTKTDGTPIVVKLEGKIRNEIWVKKVDITKTDLTNSKPVAGALVEIKDMSGKTVYREYTGTDGKLPNINLEPGVYTFEETVAPKGYIRNTTVFSFEIKKVVETIDGVETTKLVVEGATTFSDKPIKVVLTKKNLTGAETIPGAEITVYDKDGTVVYKATTDKNGEIAVMNLEVGKTYTFKETGSPDGYAINTSVFIFSVDEEGKAVGDTTVTDAVVKYTVKKTDKKGAALAGVTFVLINNETKKVVDTKITGKDGLVTFEKILFGNYSVKETKVPAGYTLSSQVITFTVDKAWTNKAAGEFNTVFVNDTTSYTISKESITDAEPLPGADITIYDAEGNEYFSGTTDKDGQITITGIVPGTYTFKEVGAPDGYKLNTTVFEFVVSEDGVITGDNTITDAPTEVEITKTDITGAETIPGAEITIKNDKGETVYKSITDKDGKITAVKLPAGTYTFKETGAPDGYAINTSEFTFTIDEDGNVTGDTTIADDVSKYSVKKTNKDGEALAGATFVLVNNATKEIVDTKITGKDGLATFEHILFGDYTVKETKVPAGYVLSTQTISFTMNNQWENKAVGEFNTTYVNDKTTHTISKKDFTSAEPLPGAEITIYDAEGKEYFKATTDENGEITITGIVPGTYTFKEVGAPDGYTLNTEVFTFTVAEDGSITGNNTVTDKPTKVVITKTDITGAKTIPGAEITIYDKEGKVVYKAVTDKDGKIEATSLPSGTYTFKETRAPNGYAINTETMTFTINEDGTVTGDDSIADEETEVTISKVDTGNNALEGVEFTMYKENGDVFDVQLTDSYGICVFTGFLEGNYTIKETKALPGFEATGRIIKVTNNGVWDNLSEGANPTVVNGTPPDTPKTGDVNVLLYVGVCVVSMAALIGIGFSKKRMPKDE